MKKFLITAVAFLALTACSSTEEPQQPKEEVAVTLSYIFAESGDMSRSEGTDAYTTFYNNQIKTKKLTPNKFNIQFKNNKDNSYYTFNSYWSRNTKFNILEGEYTVTGTSSPTSNEIDTISLSFNEIITITKDRPNITLTAINNCFLLLFKDENISSVNLTTYTAIGGNTPTKYSAKNVDGLYYIFKSSFYDSNYGSNTMEIGYTDGATNKISCLEYIPFEKGKYYYFNEYTSSFDVPAMEQGN